MKEFVPAEHRDTASSNANKFNLATDEENIDFNISGVPNAMVKRSHNINVQKIENHPQRQALQSDLQRHRAFNPFSRESQDAIKACRSIMHYTSYLRTKDCTNNGYVTNMLEHNIDTGVHMISHNTQT